MMMQGDWFAFVVEKRMAFGDGRLTMLVAKGRVAFASDTATREIHVRRTTCYAASVFQCITDANGIFHLFPLTSNKAEHESSSVITRLFFAISHTPGLP